MITYEEEEEATTLLIKQLVKKIVLAYLDDKLTDEEYQTLYRLVTDRSQYRIVKKENLERGMYMEVRPEDL